MFRDANKGLHKVDYSPEDPKSIQDFALNDDYYKTDL